MSSHASSTLADIAGSLFLVSEDIQSPGREGEPATVTVAEPANTTKGPGWDSSNNFDFTVPPNLAMGEVPFDSGWLGLDEADALNWLNSGYGHL